MDRIEITPELLADLKARAEKATQGEWICDIPTRHIQILETTTGLSTYPFLVTPSPNYDHNAEFVAAANPQVVLALIDEIKKQQNIASYLFDCFQGIKKELAELDEEANWLAAAQNWDIDAESPTRCPEGHEPPHSCVGVHDCVQCWRQAAREAVKKQCKNN